MSRLTFINRIRELDALERAWKNESAGLMICYGRRRVGKTELIKEFLENKQGLYFLADRLTEKENLRILTRLSGLFFDDRFLSEFTDWYVFFDYLKAKLSKRAVLVIDEFPYLVETNKALPSVFQKGWDEVLRNLPILLILCGSSVGMMERETMAYGSPLYGRRTGQILVLPLRFEAFGLFFPGASFSRRMELYSISGGIPAYAKLLNGNLDARQNFIEKVLEPEAYLFKEAELILKEETREPRQYFSILRAIALGKRKVGEIVNECRIEKTSLHKYLYLLEELRILEKRFPVTESNIEKSRQGLFFLADRYFSFWFDFVFPYRSDLTFGNKKPSIMRFDQAFVHHVASAYEEVGQYVLTKFEKQLFPFHRIGRWWDRTREIDIVAIDETGHEILFAEVKWSSKKVGTDIFEDLVAKSAAVPGEYRRRFYALLSRSGFTSSMIRLAREKNVLLIHQEERV